MISAIILAAGESKRMGNENKLLLPFDGEALIKRFVKSVCLSKVDSVQVVIGFESEKIKNVLLDQPVDYVYNPDYMKGMTTSIKAGVRASSKSSDGYMICLADMPSASTNDFNMLLRSFSFLRKKEIEFISVPIYKGKRGNPVIFSKEFKKEILRHKGEGCRGIIEQNSSKVRKVIMPNSNLLNDIDIMEDYENNLIKLGL